MENLTTRDNQEAVGLLEVFGLVCAFLAADAGCKAANVHLQVFDKNKPANADALPGTTFGHYQIQRQYR